MQEMTYNERRKIYERAIEKYGAAALFAASRICYRKKHELAGDRLLFLAYGAVIISIATLLKTRGFI